MNFNNFYILNEINDVIDMQKESKFNSSLVIKSSEISQYAYCPYAWWQQRNGVMPETKEMAKGTDFHEDFMVRKDTAKFLNSASYVVLAIIVIVLMYYFLRG